MTDAESDGAATAFFRFTEPTGTDAVEGPPAPPDGVAFAKAGTAPKVVTAKATPAVTATNPRNSGRNLGFRLITTAIPKSSLT